MAVFKCKMCGGTLDIFAGTTVVKCDYCDTTQTVPSADDEKKLALFTRANRLRAGNEFDKASGIYESIVADFPEEAEAYWGLVLCKYGVEYVDDPATGTKIPTCHRSSFESVMDDNNFDLTLEYADAYAKRVYREEAKQLEEIRKGIIEVSSKEAPYDIFICYKETDEHGDRTIDSVLSQDIYDVLTEKGYRTFFARITLEDKLGQEYEPYIFAALNTAKIMLAVGTSFEHYDAVWVKNEWSRYLKLMANDKTKHLIPCYKDIDAYDMPKAFTKLQAQDMGKVGYIQDLVRGIEKLCPKNSKIGYAGSADIEELLRKKGPAFVANVCAIGTRDYNNMWPAGTPRRVFNYDEFNVIAFNITVSKAKLAYRRTVKLGTIICNEQGARIIDEEVTLDWASNYDRISKTFIIRGGDGIVVPAGKYHAEFWVDESASYGFDFTVTSNEEIREQRRIQEIKNSERRPQWRAANLCQHCGGTFKGFFTKNCAVCGKKKDY